jgi:hypothetical protein
MKEHSFCSARGSRVGALRVLCLLFVIGLLMLATIQRAEADTYDPQRAGNPLRIVAYVLHPVGFVLDYGLMRPCFWLVQRQPFRTVFGYVPARNQDPPEEEQGSY